MVFVTMLHVPSDVHGWINEIPVVSIYDLAKAHSRDRVCDNQRGFSVAPAMAHMISVPNLAFDADLEAKC